MAVGRKADYTASIPQLWEKRLIAEAEHLTFWGNMEGTPGSSMPIIRRDDLAQGPGDVIKFDIVLALTGAGLTGDSGASLLENNEEALKIRQSSVTVTTLQHAVRWTALAELLITHDMRTTALNQLAKWLAGKLDDRIFTELTGQAGATVVPDKNKWFPGTATTRATVADTLAAGKLTLDTITELKAYAQTELKIEPLRMEDGQEIFGLVVHPYAALALKRDDTKWAQAQRDAAVRGASNPLFTGAVGMWDGVVIWTSNRVPRTTNGTIDVADNVFFGAQALSRGYAAYPRWIEQSFSYGQEAGVATWTVLGEKLNVFDLTSGGGAAATAFTAIGSMVVYTAAVRPTQP